MKKYILPALITYQVIAIILYLLEKIEFSFWVILPMIIVFLIISFAYCFLIVADILNSIIEK